MNQGFVFKIYLDDEQVGVAEETQSGFQSYTFRSKDGDQFASSILQNRHFHGHYDQWLATNSKSSDVPFYVADAATVLYAFHVLNHSPQPAHKPAELLGAAAVQSSEPAEAHISS